MSFLKEETEESQHVSLFFFFNYAIYYHFFVDTLETEAELSLYAIVWTKTLRLFSVFLFIELFTIVYKCFLS